MLWVLDLLGVGWELLGVDLLLLDLSHVLLHLRVDPGVKLTVLSHHLQGFVLVGSHRVLQGKFTLSLDNGISYRLDMNNWLIGF